MREEIERADVAARAAGLNAVFVPHPHTWALEHAGFDDPAVFTLGSLSELTSHFQAT